MATSQVPVWSGSVTVDGQLAMQPLEAGQRRAFLRSLSGQPVDVVIRRRRSKRSAEQNAWLWGVALPVLAESFGYDQHEHEMLHYQLLAECFGERYDQRFGRAVPCRTSSQLNTQEFSQYMEWLTRWAAVEHGIRVPLPGESERA